MSDSLKWHNGTEWWEAIGLRYSGLQLVSARERQTQEALTGLLRKHPPVGFTGEVPGEVFSLEELSERLREEIRRVELGGEPHAAAEERSKQGRERVERALTDPALAEPIEDGRWAGFTRGEAIAWCWNLFQYEPKGFISPGSQLRAMAMRALEADDLPEVFGYPERARELAEQGLSPRDYRRYKEAVGAKTFTPADVRFG